MSYVALYRKFRPRLFKDLVGQEHIVRTLLNQLESGKIAHAYLFAGPRGTGKTSTAKLFARAINCANTVSGEPCGECEACKAFNTDENLDIIEIDAASNNGVDNIREIRDKVVFTPSLGKYKVYIIDEVHMLSGGAFNALLKTLEEPPKHVVFILATTEIHKLPATVLSRCQRFDFKLISSNTIFDRLKYVLEQSNLDFEDKAIDLIAKSAQGGMRDALSLADVCISYCGNKVTFDDAINVLGLSDRNFVFTFGDAILNGDIKEALRLCHNLEREGKDIGVFVLELMAHMRDIMLTMFSPDSDEIKALPIDIQEKLKKQAEKGNSERVLRSIEILSRLESEVKLHTRLDIQLETAIVRICTPEIETDYSAINDRITFLEEKIKNGNFSDVKKEDKPVSVEREKTEKKEPQPSSTKKTQVQSIKTSSVWENVIAQVKNRDIALYMMLRSLYGQIEEDKFVIYISEDLKNKEPIVNKNSQLLTEIIKSASGLDLKIKTVIGTKPHTEEENEQNDLMKAALDLFS